MALSSAMIDFDRESWLEAVLDERRGPHEYVSKNCRGLK